MSRHTINHPYNYDHHCRYEQDEVLTIQEDTTSENTNNSNIATINAATGGCDDEVDAGEHNNLKQSCYPKYHCYWLSFWFFTIITILVIVAGGTVSTILLLQKKSQTTSSIPTTPVTTTTVKDQEYYMERYEQFRTVLLSYEVIGSSSSSTSATTESSPELLLTQSDTPQYKALNWMVYSDATIDHTQLHTDSNNNSDGQDIQLFLQRYTIMILYYTWGGTGIGAISTNSNGNRRNDLLWAWDITTTGPIHTCQWNTNTIQCNSIKDPLFITELYFHQYQIYGTIPYELHTISTLQTFDISKNYFYGTIPTNLFKNMIHLQDLHIDNNEFTGLLPTSIGNCTALEKFYIGYNTLTGTIPLEYQNLQNIQYFYSPETLLYGNFFKTFGISWSKYIQSINIDNSLYTGSIPSNVVLHWSHNTTLKELHLGRHLLSGTLPTEIGLLTKLTNFNTMGTELYGVFPDITLMTNLRFLTVDGPFITGTISTSIGSIQSLEYIYIRNTGITGSIPKQIGMCTNLQEIFIAENANLVGTIPSEIGNLPSLHQLTLQKNYALHNGSSIPDTLCASIQSGMLAVARSCDIACTCCIVNCDL